MDNSDAGKRLLVSYDFSSDSSEEDEEKFRIVDRDSEDTKVNFSLCTETPNNFHNGKIIDNNFVKIKEIEWDETILSGESKIINENKKFFEEEKLNESHSVEFPLPQINEDGEVFKSNDSNELIELIQLNNLVRQKYREYLVRLLTTNYKTCSTNNKEDRYDNADIKECAKFMELNAVQSSIVVNLYRKSMLKMISEIRNNTENHKLSNHLCNHKLNREKFHKNVHIQTDSDGYNEVKLLQATVSSTLDDKIKIFEQRMEYETKKRKRQEYLHHAKKKREQKSRASVSIKPVEVSSSCPAVSEVIALPENLLSEDDTIMKEMEKLFGSINEHEEGVDLFGDGTIFVKEKTEVIEPTNSIIEIMVDNEAETMRKLKDSLWPCELHYQLLNLKHVMLDIADKGYRHHVKIQTKFIQLFGENPDYDEYENDDDLIGLYSPSIELNDVLLASCKKRIAPWIVKHLMKPLNEGLIANKYLFKTLAKHLSETILHQDQHPDERAIVLFIQNYFTIHPYIHYIEDIN